MIEPERPDLSGVKAVFFDLDDTLCGYWDASKHGLRKAFEAHGPAGYPADEMVRHWAAAFREFAPTLKQTGWYETYLKTGEPTRTEQMRRTLNQIDIVDEDRAQRLSEAYMLERDGALQLFEDAIDVLQKLKGKYPLGLVTNGPADIQRMEIATLKLDEFFDHVFIEGEMGIGKPAPIVFERAADAVGCSPSELLFVGNSFDHDILPAIKAGWFTAWVRRPSDVPPSADGRRAALAEPAPDAPKPTFVINELRELLPILGLPY